MSDKQYRCSDAPECATSYCRFYGKYIKTDDYPERYFNRRYCAIVGRDVHSVLTEDSSAVTELVTAARDALRALDYEASGGSFDVRRNDALRAALAAFDEVTG